MLQRPELDWDAAAVIDSVAGHGTAVASVDALLDALHDTAQAGDHVLFMSNGGFENAPRRFVERLQV